LVEKTTRQEQEENLHTFLVGLVRQEKAHTQKSSNSYNILFVEYEESLAWESDIRLQYLLLINKAKIIQQNTDKISE
jgi:hypothetical protein